MKRNERNYHNKMKRNERNYHNKICNFVYSSWLLSNYQLPDLFLEALNLSSCAIVICELLWHNEHNSVTLGTQKFWLGYSWRLELELILNISMAVFDGKCYRRWAYKVET